MVYEWIGAALRTTATEHSRASARSVASSRIRNNPGGVTIFLPAVQAAPLNALGLTVQHTIDIREFCPPEAVSDSVTEVHHTRTPVDHHTHGLGHQPGRKEVEGSFRLGAERYGRDASRVIRKHTVANMTYTKVNGVLTSYFEPASYFCSISSNARSK